MGQIIRRFERPRPGAADAIRRTGRSPIARWRPVGVLIAVGTVLALFKIQPGEVDSAADFQLCVRGQPANCVIDGDTIRHAGVKIRLEDIDTPETHRPQCAAEAALGRKATLRLLELLNAGPFTLARAGRRDEDRYGRKLRVIRRDGRSLSSILVAEGLARNWDGARRSWCG